MAPAGGSIFLVNAPIGVALFALAVLRLPLDERRSRERLDIGGVVVFTTGLLLLVLPLMLGRDSGWPMWTLLALLASVPTLALFAPVERRVRERGGHPVLQLQLFASRAVGWGLAAQAAATVTYASLLFIIALYLQHGLGKSPLYSGIAVLGWVIGFGLSGPMRSVPRHVSHLAAPAGFALLAAAFLALTFEGLLRAPRGAPLVLTLACGGLGMGAGVSSLIGTLTATVRRELASDLSGVLSTNSEVFSASVATFGTLYLGLARTDDVAGAVHALRWVTAALGASALLAAAAARRATTSL